MKIGKYEFTDKSQADTKLESVSNAVAVVRLGNIILEDAQLDEDLNEIQPPTLSDKYHIDVMWEGLDDHPYGWKSYAVNVADGNGVHSFYGIDYQTHKL